MARTPLARSSLTWVIVGAVLCLIVGAVIPPMYAHQTRPLTTDAAIEVATQPADALYFDLRAYQDRSPHLEAPECRGETAPPRCFITSGKAQLSRSTTTYKLPETRKEGVVGSDSTTTFSVDGRQLAQLTEASVLNRESTYPVAGPSTTQSVSFGDEEGQPRELEREGIHYFFPSETEQRSYPYYDNVTDNSVPLDFTGTEKIAGVPTYTFEQKTGPESIAESSLPGGLASLSGPARNFYNAEELAQYRLAPETTVVLNPYYSVERKVWVEPTTGTVVNIEEHVRVSYAADLKQAGDASRSRDRTLLDTDFNWDQGSRDRALSAVSDTVTKVKWMSIIGWTGKLLAVILLVLAAVMRRRRG